MNIAFSSRMRNPPREVLRGEVEEVLADMVDDIIDNSSEGSQLLGIFVADPDAKFFLDGHKSFEDVERVEAEVIV